MNLIHWFMQDYITSELRLTIDDLINKHITDRRSIFVITKPLTELALWTFDHGA